MDSPKKKRHSHAELIEIFSQKKIPDEFHSRFINEYDRIFNELYEDAKDWIDDDFNEDESVQSSALDVTFMFVEPFLEQIEIGHSAEWAEIMAKYSEEDENVAFHYAYQGVFEKDSVINQNNYAKTEKVIINTEENILLGRAQDRKKISMAEIDYNEKIDGNLIDSNKNG